MPMKTNDRNYGIDLLRIVAIFMIVMLHLNNHAGIMVSTVKGTVNHNISWFIHIAVYCGANCYALISGYVGVKAKTKYANIIYLYLQVVFYLLVSGVLFYYLKPGSMETKYLVERLMPVHYNYYWYFTAYFGMFFFIPFMNKLLLALNKKQLKGLMLTIFVLFSLRPSALLMDRFRLEKGYSLLWLAALYLIGGCIKLLELEKKINKTWLLIMYFMAVMLTYACNNLEGINRESFLFSYTSPTVLISAIALLMLFAKAKIKHIGKKIIGFFAPLTFGVYLIHTEPLIWNHIIAGKLTQFGQAAPLLFFLYWILAAMILWFVCAIIDYIRLLIFKLLHIRQIATFLEKLGKKIAFEIIGERTDGVSEVESDSELVA